MGNLGVDPDHPPKLCAGLYASPHCWTPAQDAVAEPEPSPEAEPSKRPSKQRTLVPADRWGCAPPERRCAYDSSPLDLKARVVGVSFRPAPAICHL